MEAHFKEKCPVSVYAKLHWLPVNSFENILPSYHFRKSFLAWSEDISFANIVAILHYTMSLNCDLCVILTKQIEIWFSSLIVVNRENKRFWCKNHVGTGR